MINAKEARNISSDVASKLNRQCDNFAKDCGIYDDINNLILEKAKKGDNTATVNITDMFYRHEDRLREIDLNKFNDRFASFIQNWLFEHGFKAILTDEGLYYSESGIIRTYAIGILW